MQEQNDKINYYVNCRYNDFKDNTSRMLDSILKHRSDLVRTDRIILTNQIITDKHEVLEHVRTHFENWTKANPPNEEVEDDWKEAYLPLANIDPSIYESLTHAISLDEIQSTIDNAPKNKATGPSSIPNEVLLHLPISAIKILQKIFNSCLRLNHTPKQ